MRNEKPLVMIFYSVRSECDQVAGDHLRAMVEKTPFLAGWTFLWATSIEEGKTIFQESPDIIDCIVFAAVLRLGVSEVVEFVQWLHSPVPPRDRSTCSHERLFRGKIVVASVDPDLQAEVVKAGAQYAIPKESIIPLLPAICST